MKDNTESQCCPKFDPTKWDDKVFKWSDKKFIKDKVFTFFYMPVNFGQVITRMTQKVESACVKMPDWLCLSDHTSKWNMDLYLAVDQEVSGADNVVLTGKFYSRVYEGDFKDTGKWCADFEVQAKEKGLSVKKYFMWYTTCPKCAKKYGKNYVVVVGQVE
jgi:hypothetical protein